MAGRPKVKVDEDLLRKLAAIHCTQEEMSAILGVSRDVLTRRYSTIIEQGKSEGQMSLRRRQWLAAEGGNVAMLIWLGKQWLKQTERQEVTGPGGAALSFVALAREASDDLDG
jgi:transcriptional regulator with XRE-family HTH domain